MTFQIVGTVEKNERIGSLYFLMTFRCPPIADEIKPGQFIMLRVSDNVSPLLRRPFSIYRNFPSDHPEKKTRGCLLILYKVVGKGTRMMAQLRKGQELDILGPLGNGFALPPLPSSAPAVLLGGGVGIVSLVSLAESLASLNLCVFIGGRTRDDILCKEDFEKLNVREVYVATEDGSLGYKGTVIDLFLSKKKAIEKSGAQYLYTCGPTNMLRELAASWTREGTVCQASLEARMGCGFGACWGCVIKTKHPNTPYQRVCKEGPVFNLKDLVWEVG